MSFHAVLRFQNSDTGVIDFPVQGFSWDMVSLPIAEVAPGLASALLASIFSEVAGVECGLLLTRNLVASKTLAVLGVPQFCTLSQSSIPVQLMMLPLLGA